MTLEAPTVVEAQALALALERLRRAADAHLVALAMGAHLDKTIQELEAAHASSNTCSEAHLAWAQDVLDGRVPVKKYTKPEPPETFDAMIRRARGKNVYVHFVHTLEGTEYAIYRDHKKIAHSRSEKNCRAVLTRIIGPRKKK